jgi:hypothetical protein
MDKNTRFWCLQRNVAICTYNRLSCHNSRWMSMKLWILIKNPSHGLQKTDQWEGNTKLLDNIIVSTKLDRKNYIVKTIPEHWFPYQEQEHLVERQWDRESFGWKPELDVLTHWCSSPSGCNQSLLLHLRRGCLLQLSSMSSAELEHSLHQGQPGTREFDNLIFKITFKELNC